MREQEELIMSALRKTWILDFDGTLVVHNGYKTGADRWLPGAKEFMLRIPEEDFILILTAREKEAASKTEAFLYQSGVRYDWIFYEMPMGERILLNDSKPSGLRMSYSIECCRNKGLEALKITIDPSL